MGPGCGHYPNLAKVITSPAAAISPTPNCSNGGNCWECSPPPPLLLLHWNPLHVSAGTSSDSFVSTSRFINESGNFYFAVSAARFAAFKARQAEDFAAFAEDVWDSAAEGAAAALAEFGIERATGRFIDGDHGVKSVKDMFPNENAAAMLKESRMAAKSRRR